MHAFFCSVQMKKKKYAERNKKKYSDGLVYVNNGETIEALLMLKEKAEKRCYVCQVRPKAITVISNIVEMQREKKMKAMGKNR